MHSIKGKTRVESYAAHLLYLPIRLLCLAVFLAAIFTISAFFSITFAATYGSGNYGSGQYNIGQSNTSSTSNSSAGSASAPSCTSTQPSSAPDLFQINTTDTVATLYFAPAGKPYNNYFVAFGLKQNDETYGGSFNQGEVHGVLSFTVRLLSPNTTYFFKVRAGNDCAAGPWSASIMAKTTGNSKKTGVYYKNAFTAFTTTIGKVFKQDKTKNTLNVQNSQSTQPSRLNSSQSNQLSTPSPGKNPSANQTPRNQNWFTGIFSAIKHLFGK